MPALSFRQLPGAASQGEQGDASPSLCAAALGAAQVSPQNNFLLQTVVPVIRPES